MRVDDEVGVEPTVKGGGERELAAVVFILPAYDLRVSEEMAGMEMYD